MGSHRRLAATGRGRKKIDFVCTDEWFFRSHFEPLYQAACNVENSDVCLITKPSPQKNGCQEKELNIVALDFVRTKLIPSFTLKTSIDLLRFFRQRRPNIIHFIGLRPIIYGGLVSILSPRCSVVYHLTGTGYLAAKKSLGCQLVFQVLLMTLSLLVRRKKSRILVENEDDLKLLERYNKNISSSAILLGGAGVDPDVFKVPIGTTNSNVRVAFVGRMIWSKGVDLLVQASNKLAAKNIETQFDLYGQPDEGNPEFISRQQLDVWSQSPNLTWHNHSTDVVSVWQKSDIYVLASRGGEGLPRSLLEAAACSRPLIVTDVPGCRHFVRNGIEGFVVPPEDSDALAEAIERLSNDEDLRRSMGNAARQRVLEFYTEDHVKNSVLSIYKDYLQIKDAVVPTVKSSEERSAQLAV